MAKRYSVDALVVKVKDWRGKDDAKFFTLFTRERGRIEACAFGLGKMKGDLAGALQFFNRLDVEIVEGDRVDTIRDAKITHAFKIFRNDLDAIAYGSILCEVVSEIFPREQPEPEVFDILLNAFETCENRNVRISSAVAGFQIMEHSGSQLLFSNCASCQKQIQGNEFFNIAEGGALCRECATRLREYTPQTFVYREATRLLIENFLAFDWDCDHRLSVDSISLYHAETILRRHIESIVGFPLNSYKFLDMIKKQIPNIA
ncbi:MAG: DNA repair protein RecO [Selenomonadaceae bacterium]|nr:DNA repair protein RecO [Selenomonadaceae bacterium]